MSPSPSPVNSQFTQSVVSDALYPVVPPPPVVEAHLSPALRYLESFPQFIVYFLTPSTERAGKLDKLPINLATKSKLEWTTPSNWMTYQAALAAASPAGPQYGVGFVITPETKLFCLDVDGARLKGVSCPGCFNEDTRALFMAADFPEGLNAPNPECATCKGNGIDKWHGLVDKLRLALPRAGVELSVSYEGLHNWGRYEGPEPDHAKVKVVEGVKIELYTSGKWFALGDQAGALGDAGADCTVELQRLIADYFLPSAAATGDAEWTEESYPGAIAATIDDDELLRRALRSHSANARFTGKASVADLWAANELTLGKSYPDAGGRAYDASSADSGLAHHLAWWTGGNCEQIERLMRRADCGLVRDKWDRRGTYLRDTILKAVANTEGFYGDKNAPVAAGSAGALSAGTPGALSAGTPGAASMPPALTVPSGTPDELTPEDFWAILPTHSYINTRTGEFHGVDAVNAHLKRFTEGICQSFKPAAWLDMFRVCHQMSWQPAHPQIIDGMVSKDGYLEPDPKGRIYNLYRPSKAVPTEDDASPWVNHVRALFPGDAEHIFKWFAFRVQYPGTKINHALVIGGAQGIGKDLMLEPLRYGVGIGNFADLNPSDLFKDFTKWVESTLVVINEARDLGDVDRYKFYDNCKRFIAAPPDNLPCNKKGIESYSVPNVMAVVITSNNKLSGLYIDPDDRRHYVAWSAAEKESPAYFESLWNWMLEGGGKQAVLGYLQRYNLAGWDPKAPPTKTEAWYQMVAAHANPEESALGDALEGIMLATFQEIIVKLQLGGHMDLLAIFQDRKNAKKAARLLECAGLEYLPNPGAKGDRRWSLNGKRETLYASRALPLAERLRLANGRTAGQ
jgi:Family of unknown function (DUF5906)